MKVVALFSYRFPAVSMPIFQPCNISCNRLFFKEESSTPKTGAKDFRESHSDKVFLTYTQKAAYRGTDFRLSTCPKFRREKRML